MNSLLLAVHELRHVANQLSSIKKRVVTSASCSNLPADLRMMIMSFLSGWDSVSLCSVDVSWRRTRHTERAARWLHLSLFGVCTPRDMEIFEFEPTTPWTRRFEVRWLTLGSWISMGQDITSSLVINDPDFSQRARDAMVLDGSVLRVKDKQFDLLRGQPVTAGLQRSSSVTEVVIPERDAVMITNRSEIWRYSTSRVDVATQRELFTMTTHNGCVPFCDPTGEYLCMYPGFTSRDPIRFFSAKTGQHLVDVKLDAHSMIFMGIIGGQALFRQQGGSGQQHSLRVYDITTRQWIKERIFFPLWNTTAWIVYPQSTTQQHLFGYFRGGLMMINRHSLATPRILSDCEYAERDADARLSLAYRMEYPIPGQRPILDPGFGNLTYICHDGRCFRLQFSLSGFQRIVFNTRWLVAAGEQCHVYAFGLLKKGPKMFMHV